MEKTSFLAWMIKSNGMIHCRYCSVFDENGKLFAPMMPTQIVEEKQSTDTVMMYAWKRYLYKKGWNIDTNGFFLCPDHAAKTPKEKLTLNDDLYKVQDWVTKEADKYDQWVKEMEEL